MKSAPLRPWSLLDEAPEDVAAPVEGEVAAPTAKSGVRQSIQGLLNRWRPTPQATLAIVTVSAAWTLAICLTGAGGGPTRVLNCLGVGVCNLCAIASLYLMSRVSRKGSECVEGASHSAGDIQEVWKQVESQTAGIQTRLNEVLEEHSQMGLELSLAAAQKRQITGILEAVLDPILAVDAFDQVQLINGAAEELLGIHRQEAQRKPLADVIRDEKLHQMLIQAREAESRAAKRRIEYAIGARTFAVALSPVALDSSPDSTDAHRHGVVALFRDISKEKEAARHKSEFVAHAAHELRTPLSAIIAYMEMLVDGEAGDEKTRAEYYEIIQTAARRLGRMIDNILNISRIEAGTVRIQKAPVAISVLVKEAADTLRPKAEEKKLTLSEELAPVVDRVLGDRDLLEQAVLNLISNAIKYTPEGGQILVRMSTHDNRLIRIEVTDSGVGIPKEDLPRMFEKFFRVEANKGMAPGTGLGLSLVKQVVETVHGGEVSIASEVGRGSTFAMMLPLYDGM